MNFTQVIKALNEGKVVTRKGWHNPEMFIFLVPGSTFTVNRAPLLGIFPEGTVVNYRSHIDMYDAEGMVGPWVGGQVDMISDDWEIVSG